MQKYLAVQNVEKSCCSNKILKTYRSKTMFYTNMMLTSKAQQPQSTWFIVIIFICLLNMPVTSICLCSAVHMTAI